MPFNIWKEDLRIFKTKKSVCVALFALLEQQNFKKITIKDICEEAVISRATFYSHFIDKYDLLKYWLDHLIFNDINRDATYEDLEKTINQFVLSNKIIIKNIMEDADHETMEIVFEFILSSLQLMIDSNEQINPKYIVLSNILAGGIVYYLLWHVKNKYPFDVMNRYLYDIIDKFHELELQ